MADERAGPGALPAPRSLEGRFLRHQAARFEALRGTRFGGRYSPPEEYEAIYLARPLEAVAAEAYRHLVDPLGVEPAMVSPRLLFEVEVGLRRVLDLRSDETIAACGLSRADLAGDHDRCRAAGRAAYEAGYEGVLAPAASGLGETLCVFAERVRPESLTVVERRLWELPADPRASGRG